MRLTWWSLFGFCEAGAEVPEAEMAVRGLAFQTRLGFLSRKELHAHAKVREHLENFRQCERIHKWLVGPTGDPAIFKLEGCEKRTELILRELREYIVSDFAKFPHVIGCAHDPVCVASCQVAQFLVGLCESRVVDWFDFHDHDSCPSPQLEERRDLGRTRVACAPRLSRPGLTL